MVPEILALYFFLYSNEPRLPLQPRSVSFSLARDLQGLKNEFLVRKCPDGTNGVVILPVPERWGWLWVDSPRFELTLLCIESRHGRCLFCGDSWIGDRWRVSGDQ